MQRLFTAGLKQAILNLLFELRTWVRHQKAVYKAERLPVVPDKLHLGCGPNYKPGWLNVDLGGVADLKLDLRERFPFPDNSFFVIYNEHFFEHVDYPDAAGAFLDECLRTLKPGGMIRIGVPDTQWPLQEYCGVRNGDYFALAKKHYWHPQWCQTEMEHINYHFRQDGEHRFAYDHVTLEKILHTHGFTNVTKTSFDPEFDSETRKTGTLYVNAFKP